MKNSAEHPGLSSEFAEIDSTVGGPRRRFAAGGAPGTSKVAASIEFAREGCRVTAKLKRAEHSRSDAQARRFQRQSDQRAVVAVIAQQSHGACGAPEKKRSWINPRRHSQMLSNSKIAVFIRLLVFRSKIPAARPEILLMPCSCFTSVGEGSRMNSTSSGCPDAGILLPS